jgi:hypothetical protein
MARPLRFVPPGALVEVTTRTVHERLLLRPSAELNDIVHEWRQKFWGRRYRAIVVADDEAAIARLRYILSNGCKEGLVDRPADWPGVSCARALTAGGALRGTWYDRTAEHQARARGQRVVPGQFSSQCEVRLESLPCWRTLSPARHRAACADLVAQVETETRAERRESGRPCVGRDRLLAQDPHERPARSENSTAPFVHGSCDAVKAAFSSAYTAFVDAFRAAAAGLRCGEIIDFPAGAFPPGLPFVMPAAPA